MNSYISSLLRQVVVGEWIGMCPLAIVFLLWHRPIVFSFALLALFGRACHFARVCACIRFQTTFKAVIQTDLGIFCPWRKIVTDGKHCPSDLQKLPRGAVGSSPNSILTSPAHEVPKLRPAMKLAVESAVPIPRMVAWRSHQYRCEHQRFAGSRLVGP